MRELVNSSKVLASTKYVIEVKYGKRCYLINSRDLEFYLETKRQYEDFDDWIWSNI